MRLFVRDSKFYKLFFSLAGTVALQNLIVFGVNLADNVMIGGYSELALNAVALVNQVQFLLQMTVIGVGNGLIVIASQYWGKRQLAPIRRVFAVASLLGFLLSLLLTVIAAVTPDGLLGLLTDKVEVIEEGKKYLAVMLFSYCIFAFTNILLCALRSVEKVRIGFWVSLTALFSNIFLNYALIYGHFGFPEMGIRGAAIATLTSRIIEFLIVFFYAFVYDKQLGLKIKDLFGIELSFVRDFAKSGLFLTFSSLSWGIAMSVQTAILGHLEEASALGASSIATTVFQVVSVIFTSLASAASVVIGKTVGENRIDDLKKYAVTLQIIFILSGFVSSAILFSMRGAIVSLYDVTPETAKMARDFITVLSVTVIGTAYQMPALSGIVSGGGDTKFVFYNDLIFMWGIVLPVSALSAFVFHYPVVVTFICLKLDQILKCVVTVPKVNRFGFIKKLTRE